MLSGIGLLSEVGGPAPRALFISARELSGKRRVFFYKTSGGGLEARLMNCQIYCSEMDRVVGQVRAVGNRGELAVTPGGVPFASNNDRHGWQPVLDGPIFRRHPRAAYTGAPPLISQLDLRVGEAALRRNKAGGLTLVETFDDGSSVERASFWPVPDQDRGQRAYVDRMGKPFPDAVFLETEIRAKDGSWHSLITAYREGTLQIFSDQPFASSNSLAIPELQRIQQLLVGAALPGADRSIESVEIFSRGGKRIPLPPERRLTQTELPERWKEPVRIGQEELVHWKPHVREYGGELEVVYRNGLRGQVTNQLTVSGGLGGALVALPGVNDEDLRAVPAPTPVVDWPPPHKRITRINSETGEEEEVWLDEHNREFVMAKRKPGEDWTLVSFVAGFVPEGSVVRDGKVFMPRQALLVPNDRRKRKYPFTVKDGILEIHDNPNETKKRRRKVTKNAARKLLTVLLEELPWLEQEGIHTLRVRGRDYRVPGMTAPSAETPSDVLASDAPADFEVYSTPYGKGSTAYEIVDGKPVLRMRITHGFRTPTFAPRWIEGRGRSRYEVFLDSGETVTFMGDTDATPEDILATMARAAERERRLAETAPPDSEAARRHETRARRIAQLVALGRRQRAGQDSAGAAPPEPRPANAAALAATATMEGDFLTVSQTVGDELNTTSIFRAAVMVGHKEVGSITVRNHAGVVDGGVTIKPGWENSGAVQQHIAEFAGQVQQHPAFANVRMLDASAAKDDPDGFSPIRPDGYPSNLLWRQLFPGFSTTRADGAIHFGHKTELARDLLALSLHLDAPSQALMARLATGGPDQLVAAVEGDDTEYWVHVKDLHSFVRSVRVPIGSQLSLRLPDPPTDPLADVEFRETWPEVEAVTADPRIGDHWVVNRMDVSVWESLLGKPVVGLDNRYGTVHALTDTPSVRDQAEIAEVLTTYPGRSRQMGGSLFEYAHARDPSTPGVRMVIDPHGLNQDVATALEVYRMLLQEPQDGVPGGTALALLSPETIRIENCDGTEAGLLRCLQQAAKGSGLSLRRGAGRATPAGFPVIVERTSTGAALWKARVHRVPSRWTSPHQVRLKP